jgi:hypothetical protein
MPVGFRAFASGEEAFAVFKSFKGAWVIQSGEKTLPFKMTYDTGSRESIVTELFGRELSVFYRDGDSLLMTHFCNAGNQPRLKLKEGGRPGHFEFEMYDITNLKDPEGGSHVQRAVYNVVNDKRIELELVWRKGQSEESEKYVLTRN